MEQEEKPTDNKKGIEIVFGLSYDEAVDLLPDFQRAAGRGATIKIVRTAEGYSLYQIVKNQE